MGAYRHSHRIDVCLGSVDDTEPGSTARVRVVNPTLSDITVDKGSVAAVAVASLYSSAICEAGFGERRSTLSSHVRGVRPHQGLPTVLR